MSNFHKELQKCLFLSFKGTDAFWGHDYLWTDSNEICTAYVKIENKSHFIPEKFLIFDLVFEKITIFMFLRSIFFFFFLKNRSQKPSMLEQKQGQFWNLHRIPNKTLNPEKFVQHM